MTAVDVSERMWLWGKIMCVVTVWSHLHKCNKQICVYVMHKYEQSIKMLIYEFT
jgi:hypothetical protein